MKKNPFENLLGMEVEFDRGDSGFVAAIDYDKGITIKDEDGKDIFCLNKAEFDEGLHWASYCKVGTWDDEFWYVVSCIYNGYCDYDTYQETLLGYVDNGPQALCAFE